MRSALRVLELVLCLGDSVTAISCVGSDFGVGVVLRAYILQEVAT